MDIIKDTNTDTACNQSGLILIIYGERIEDFRDMKHVWNKIKKLL
jgi:hypothetical protein